MLPTLTLRQPRGSLLPPCFRASSSVRSQSSSAAGSRIRHPGAASALAAVKRRLAAGKPLALRQTTSGDLVWVLCVCGILELRRVPSPADASWASPRSQSLSRSDSSPAILHGHHKEVSNNKARHCHPDPRSDLKCALASEQCFCCSIRRIYVSALARALSQDQTFC